MQITNTHLSSMGFAHMKQQQNAVKLVGVFELKWLAGSLN